MISRAAAHNWEYCANELPAFTPVSQLSWRGCTGENGTQTDSTNLESEGIDGTANGYAGVIDPWPGMEMTENVDTRHSVDTVLLESMKLSNENTAQVFSVPMTAFGLLDRGIYSNARQEAKPLIQNSAGPMTTRIGAPTSRFLLEPDARHRVYLEHDHSGILRGDAMSRSEACWIIGPMGDFVTANMRWRVNRPPIDNGGGHHVWANWDPLATRPKASEVA